MLAKVFVKTPIVCYIRRSNPYAGSNVQYSSGLLEAVLNAGISIILIQNYGLIEDQTVKKNMLISMKYSKYSNKDSIINDALTAVGLKGYEKKKIFQLSGGEQQRVSIARAIAKDPLLLLCDEPTGALDSKTGVEVLKLLKKQCDANNGENTVIIVTHNSLIAEVADRVIRLKNGKVESNTLNENPKNIEEVEW